ncbi:phage tail tube protein [Cellulosimicrobium sp. I38E]|uniref:phage tail tube protein n=1 Tax=Cellulosimicrobium sp. I38E TaxID=1393139 RepID=UPI0007B289F2|nr:IPT/TIG domain-containing protein [Cellulosimicrobium sp. I38E]KZM78401.1 hypothetical protein A0J59_13810 [Cellulosimicrobium sp. I38E]
MPLPPTVPAGFEHASSYEYAMDVNLGSVAEPLWQRVRLLTNLTVTRPKTTRDEQTYEDNGAPNQGITGVGHQLVPTLDTPRKADGSRLPEYAKMRDAANSKGEANTLHVRWYDFPKTEGMTPDPDDAWEGFVTTDETWVNTGPTGEVRASQFTLTGKGEAHKIPNPASTPGASTPPAITAVTPAGRSAGEQVTITGQNFVGVTGVTIDALAVGADAFTVVNASTIIAVIPATAAGPSDVVVTNAAGSSDPVSYTVA